MVKESTTEKGWYLHSNSSVSLSSLTQLCFYFLRLFGVTSTIPENCEDIVYFIVIR